MHKSATKCNETIGKWCKNKHGASKIIDMFETYQGVTASFAWLLLLFLLVFILLAGNLITIRLAPAICHTSLGHVAI
jgi:hypothetical protein